MATIKKIAFRAMNEYTKSGAKFPAGKLKKLIIIALITGLVIVIISIFLVVALIRWLWNAGSTTLETNPTVSSVVEGTKEEIASLLPTVPASASDFIQNNQIDAAKLAETYASLPEETQQVWLTALETSINESLRTADPAEIASLQLLLTELQKF